MIRKKLRNTATAGEATLWKYLRNRQLEGMKFRRQHSIGKYVVDFYCPNAKLAIELDGEAHTYDSINKRDRDRTLYFETLGIRVLRFENRLVFTNLENVLREIATQVTIATTPAPLLT